MTQFPENLKQIVFIETFHSPKIKAFFELNSYEYNCKQLEMFLELNIEANWHKSTTFSTKLPLTADR